MKGSDARPARGPVRFAQVNRLAMLHLVFGHMPFEKVYDVTDGMTARLAGLYERMPQSITRIDLDDQDQLLGIEQYARQGSKGTRDRAGVPGGHAHEREGGAWQAGRSPRRLRAGVADQAGDVAGERVESPPQRHGVPVVTAPSGRRRRRSWRRSASRPRTAAVTAPASVSRPGSSWSSGNHRVGAGPAAVHQLPRPADVPRGARRRRRPRQHQQREPRPGYVRPTSSCCRCRAVADDVADVWTADVAADLIRLNYGEQEPVPVITVGDVGESHEVTAATLQTLLASGALRVAGARGVRAGAVEAACADPARSPVPVPSPSTPWGHPDARCRWVQDAVPAPVAASVGPFAAN